MGQLEFLDAVKTRLDSFDEKQLTLMGLCSCKVYDRATITSTLQHFARLTQIQADYFVTTFHTYMCPSA